MSGGVAIFDDDGDDDAGAAPNEPVPRHPCPRCGFAVLDFDGFGFVACPACEFCTHPMSDSGRDGNVRCGICRKIIGVGRGEGAARGFSDGGGI